VAAVLVASVAVGCATPSQHATEARPRGETTSTLRQVAAFPDPLGGASRRPAPPAAVAPTAPPVTGAGERLLSVPWTLVAVSDGGRRITVRYHIVGCTRLGRVELRESDRSVEVAVVIADHRGGGRICLAYTTSELAAILLARPLGSRTLVHAPSAA
jgi:hypothetical protein